MSTDRVCLVGLVDRVHLLCCCRRPAAVSELCLVGDRIHAHVHHRCDGGYWIRFWKHIQHCGMVQKLQDDLLHTDGLQIVGYLSAGLVFTTSAVNSLVYDSHGSKEAAAAGFILLSMVSVSSIDWLPLSLC